MNRIIPSDDSTSAAEVGIRDLEIPTSAPVPWELVGEGRYMPRRIRGSCHGRELG